MSTPQWSPQPSAPAPLPQRKWIAPFLGSFVLVAVAIGATIVFLTDGSGGPAGSSPTGPATVGEAVDTSGKTVDALAKDGLTAAELATVDKAEAFFTYYAYAMQQTKTVLTTEERTGKNEAAAAAADPEYYKVGYDHATKNLVWANDSKLGSFTFRQRCYDGQEYNNSGTGWKSKPLTSTSLCTAAGLGQYYVTDGFLPSGFTKDQAAKFVDSVRENTGLINVDKLQLDTHKGKQYLHFTVELRPIKSPIFPDGSYDGMDLLDFALLDAGLKLGSYPFSSRGGGGQGLHIEYYLDPALKLPVHSESHLIAAKDKLGKEIAFTHYDLVRTQYQFGTGTFNAATTNDALLALDW